MPDLIAISTLLQPPILRTGLLPQSSQKPPSARDIPPVTLTNIPHVDPSVFITYSKQAGSLYEAFQRAKEEDGEASTLDRTPPRSSNHEQPPALISSSQSRLQASASRSPSLESSSTPQGLSAGRPQLNRQHTGRRRGTLPVAPLSTIPPVYFEPDFRLENPRVFDIVSERSEIARRPDSNGAAVAASFSGRKALANNAILQEKLSWYMDTVEVHLISSISTASSSFFAALKSLQDLHQEAAASVAKIRSLRTDLVSLDKDMAQGGLKIVMMRTRRENMRKLGDAVQQLKEVVEVIARCEEQTDKGDIEDALQKVAMAECLIAGEPSGSNISRSTSSSARQARLIDLRGANALQGVGDDIVYLKQRIGKAFGVRFLDVLLGDLRDHADSVSPNATFERWDNAAQRSRGSHIRKPSLYPAYLHIPETLRSGLQRNLEGLAQAGCLKQATTAYRDALWREIKSLIRRHLPSSDDDDMESTLSASTQGGRRMTQQEKSSILARNLRDLDHQDAEDMLRKIYSNVGEALRRLGTQVKVVLDITSSFTSQSNRHSMTSPKSPAPTTSDDYTTATRASLAVQASVQQEDIQQTLDMTNLLGQAVDIAQTQVTKILKVRAEQSSNLPLREFLRYFNLNKLFADECEAVSGRGGAALKTVVHAHIKNFVQRAGDVQKQRLVESMDSDRWDAKDFSATHTRMLKDLVTAGTQEVPGWPKGTIVIEEARSKSDSSEEPNGGLGNGVEQVAKDKVRSANLDEQNFLLPQSALDVLCGIVKFEQIIAGIPSMTTEITTSLLDYLKLFNSRSSQLILGAGATRSAGLKNITTKHLALSSQALSFVTSLIPYIREFVRGHQINAQGLMIEFDKIKRLYQEHQAGINDKLVDIMSTRAVTHVNAMRKINWDASASSEAVNPYMETLVRETATLHKVLSKHLPDMTVKSIMNPVFSNYREQWHKAFGEVEVKTPAGKERIVRDLDHFRTRMDKLDGADGIGEAVAEVLTDKTTDVGKLSDGQINPTERKLANGDAPERSSIDGTA